MMNNIVSLIIPVIFFCAALTGYTNNTDVYSSLTHGAKDGLKITASILPNLITLLAAVYMMRASGFIDALTDAVSPVMKFLGIPPECTPLMLLRPFSGSGALAVGSDIISENGADSIAGRTAAVMLGSTETTFYVISIYFGSLGIKKLRHTLPCAIVADITGFLVAAITVKLFWG